MAVFRHHTMHYRWCDTKECPPLSVAQNKGDDKDEDTKDQNGTTEPEDTRPRALHKTCSIFLRNLAPSITKQEIEAVSVASIQCGSMSSAYGLGNYSWCRGDSLPEIFYVIRAVTTAGRPELGNVLFFVSVK